MSLRIFPHESFLRNGPPVFELYGLKNLETDSGSREVNRKIEKLKKERQEGGRKGGREKREKGGMGKERQGKKGREGRDGILETLRVTHYRALNPCKEAQHMGLASHPLALCVHRHAYHLSSSKTTTPTLIGTSEARAKWIIQVMPALLAPSLNHHYNFLPCRNILKFILCVSI